uniref:RING-type domain-containing protein n=1 Tax=Panagrolaimus superbus TaxID=310955 RepID=A0A914YR57_9BILA
MQETLNVEMILPYSAAGDKKLVYKNLHLQNVNENHQTTVYMRVRLNKVKAVLGENGETLKQICRESGAKIELSEKEPFNQFVLRGTTAQVQSGECLIREKTIQLPTHFNQQKPSDLQILPQNKVNVKHCTNEEVRPTFECGICFESFKIEEGCISCEVNAFTLEPTKEIHTVCIHCMRGYAHSAVNDIPVAFGGTGLQCASPECKNIFTLPTFEFYLSDEDYLPLKLRLQEQCLADASLEDLVICPGCGFKFCALTMTEYYRCVCGRVQCKFCPRLYNAEHIGKTCQLLDKEEEAKSVSSQKLEAKISEAVIRKCYKCGIAFVKIDGCNKMQ